MKVVGSRRKRHDGFENCSRTRAGAAMTSSKRRASRGVNALTGEGLAAAFARADAVVDVTNSGSFGDGDALAFFKQAGKTNVVRRESRRCAPLRGAFGRRR